MLLLHRASRGDRLVAGLSEVLRDPLRDPFAAEIVSVPTRGVERWLTQGVSGVLGARPGRADGVCANIEFPFPFALVGRALEAASGVGRDADPWLPERSVWPLLALVDECLDEHWLSPLAAHLGRGAGDDRPDRPDRRFSTVRHLADLFDHYGVHRPALLRQWAAGELGADEWQAQLWHLLRQRIGLPSPAERIASACARLQEDPDLVDYPSRLSIFGLTRLPASYLDVLRALATARDVHLWLLHPSPVLWERVAERLKTGPAFGPRAQDPTAACAVNPVLRAWGRDAREMQVLLAAAGAVTEEPVVDPEPPSTLLGRIQASVRADAEPSAPGTPLAPDDRSVQIHSCHGRARQVEVLKDAIVHALAADSTLEARDFIVMCPDIESFAPLIHASFGPGGEVEGVDLHVRLADRSLRQTNPVLDAIAHLLEMAGGRATVSELLDLAGLAPVRARFEFDDDALARMDDWMRDTGVRWGVDADWRQRYQLAQVGQGTWEAGLDRLLAGVAMSEDALGLVGSALPLDDVGSGDVVLAGRVAEFAERVARVLRSFESPQPLSEWLMSIQTAADLLFVLPGVDAWQSEQLQRLLDDVAAQAGLTEFGLTTSLRPAEVRSLLADRLRGVPTRANFRTGHLTMCTLVPMRSVPHRVVCLLGLDDGEFPRRFVPDGDDLLAREPWIGDRDPRSEDRQLLLDALLAAEDTLIITYSGRDERTNAPRPPSVPVTELLDLIDRTGTGEGARPARELIRVEHPLQSFDARNFEPGRLVPDGPWSFDRSALAGAEAGRRPRPSMSEPAALLPPLEVDLVSLDDLVQFVEHPVRAFCRQRLRVTVSGDSEEFGDALPITLSALDKWAVGDRLLRLCLSGASLDDAITAERSRGTLPPGRLAAEAVTEIATNVQQLVDAAAAPTREPAAVDVSVLLPSGITVAGTIGNLFGTELRTVTYSRLGPKQRLGAWVKLLALTANDPGRRWQSRSIGRGQRQNPVAVAQAAGPDYTDSARSAWAQAHLSALVDLYMRGMREPLPLAERTSAAWAAAHLAGRDPLGPARREWESSFDFPREDRDRYHVLGFGGELTIEEWSDLPLREDESGPEWEDITSRAGRLALRLWTPLVEVEVMS